jgi:hypothetical protein
MFRVALFLSGVALLVLALWLRRRQARRAEARNRTTPGVWIQSRDENWVHDGFDPSGMAHRIEIVRQTHGDIVHARQTDLNYESELLWQARRAVRLLSFFQQKAHRSEND